MPCCRTHVCFKCQSAKRGGHLGGPGDCAFCHGKMVEISYKHEVPRKSDRKGWRKLQEAVESPDWLVGHELIASRIRRQRR